MTAIGTRENIKVVLLGESSTGKTCLMNRYFKNAFSESERETIGAAFHSKVLQVKNVEYRLNCWDTSGQERFRSVCSLYYRDAKAAILCYDVRSWENFLKLDYWVNELMRYQPDCLIYLCATKADLLGKFETIPKYEIIQSYAREWNAKFFVTSAKTNMNIDELFDDILEDYILKFVRIPKTFVITDNDPIRLHNNETSRIRNIRRCMRC